MVGFNVIIEVEPHKKVKVSVCLLCCFSNVRKEESYVQHGLVRRKLIVKVEAST